MIRVCLCRGVCPGVGVRITQVPCNCVRRRYGNLAFAAGFLCFRGASTATDALATLVDPWTLEEGAVLKLPSVSADQGRGDGPTEEGEAASSGNGASSPVDDGDSSDDGAEERAAYSRPTSSHGKKQRRKDKGASAHNHAMPSRLFSDGRRLYLAVQPSPAPTIRHGGEARRVGAGARRWADLQAPVTSAGPVCGQTNPGGRGENAVRPVIPRQRRFIDEPLRSAAW